MNKEHNATPEPQASPLSSCELALEDLELVGRELMDEELKVVVGGFGVDLNLNAPSFGSGVYTGIGTGIDIDLGLT